MLDNAWLPYYYKLSCKYEKVKHLDKKRKISKELYNAFKFGGIVSLFHTYKELDKIHEQIKSLYCKL